MKKARAPRVPILENAFEIHLPKLMHAVKATGDSRVVLDDGVVRTVAVLTDTRLAVFLGGRQWVVDVVPVQCLQGRVRPLLKCPRAHEGNFQSLYFRENELACRLCQKLRYRSNLLPTAAERVRLKRAKLLALLGAQPGEALPMRSSGKWRLKYNRIIESYVKVTNTHYEQMKHMLMRKARAN